MYGPLNMLNGSNTHADSKNIFLRVSIQLLFEKIHFIPNTKYQIDIWYDMNFLQYIYKICNVTRKDSNSYFMFDIGIFIFFCLNKYFKSKVDTNMRKYYLLQK